MKAAGSSAMERSSVRVSPGSSCTRVCRASCATLSCATAMACLACSMVMAASRARVGESGRAAMRATSESIWRMSRPSRSAAAAAGPRCGGSSLCPAKVAMSASVCMPPVCGLRECKRGRTGKLWITRGWEIPHATCRGEPAGPLRPESHEAPARAREGEHQASRGRGRPGGVWGRTPRDFAVNGRHSRWSVPHTRPSRPCSMCPLLRPVLWVRPWRAGRSKVSRALGARDVRPFMIQRRRSRAAWRPGVPRDGPLDYRVVRD